MSYVAAVLTVALFAIGLRLSRITTVSNEGVEIALRAFRCVRDPTMNDVEKERALQHAALTLARCFLSITWRAAALAGASVAPLLALDFAKLASLSDVMRLLGSWQGIAATTLVMGATYFLKMKP